jgi:hypothetical protein
MESVFDRVEAAFNELRETLQLRLGGLAPSLSGSVKCATRKKPASLKQFADEELRTVLMLLVGSGVVWELAFGS